MTLMNELEMEMKLIQIIIIQTLRKNMQSLLD